jgi:iron complex outermembrane recepter protein
MRIFAKPNPARPFSRLNQYRRPFAWGAASVVFVGALSSFGGTIARADDQGTAGQPATNANANGSAGLEEIVVTARYRAESLQNTPIAITALTGADLEARGITDVTGLTESTPSTTLLKEGSTGGNTLVAYIRGLGQANYALAFQPGVPIYVDGIYQPTAYGSLLTLADVDRVDVLRGPQGTLFGKNSEGGAVSINQVDPKGDDSGYAEVGVGSYNDRRIRAAFDTSLIPNTLFMRVAAANESSDGYVNDFDYACENPTDHGTLKATTDVNCKTGAEGGVDDTYARLAFKLLASDDLTARLEATTTRDRDETVPEVPLIIDPSYPGSDLAAFNSRVAVPLTGVAVNQGLVNKNPYSNYATFNNPLSGLQYPNSNPQTIWDITGKVDWQLPDHMTFTSISGYHNQNGSIVEYKNGPIPINMVENNIRYESYSEEDRLSGTSFNDKFDWTAGLYYFHGEGTDQSDVHLVASAVGPFFGINEVLNNPTTDRDASVYLHGVYHFTDRLSLEAGARYSNDRFNYVYEGVNVASVPVNPIKPAGSYSFGVPAIPVEETTSRVDPKVALQYQWTPQFMTYAEYATGFKGAGANPQPINEAEAKPFAAEKLKSYEIGAKSEWLDHRITVNGDLYYNDVTDLQLVGYAATTLGGTITLNAGEAHISGAELEVQAKPVQDLVFNLSGDYMHFRYVSLGAAAYSPTLNPGGIFMSDTAPYSPEVKANVGVQYTIGIGPLGTLTPRLDDTYTSRIYFDPQNLLASSQGGYSLMNGHVTYAPLNGKWTAALDVNNLTNKLYYLTMFNQLSSFGILTGQPGMPRNVLVSLKYTF